MPAQSQNQQRAAGIALSAKRAGKCSSLPEGSASRQMCESMSLEDLEHFAGTKTKAPPQRVSQAKRNLKRKAFKK
jgi:hypothetical protein